MRRIVMCLVSVVGLLGLGTSMARSDPGPALFATEPSELGAPFDGWNVSVSQDEADANRLVLEFDSAAVGRRTRSIVWLNDAYRAHGGRFPAVYFLHGQGDTHSFGTGQALGAAGVPVPYPFGPPAPNQGFGGIDPGGTAAERSFLLVGVDNGSLPWCGHCWWVDGIGDAGVDAERHLLDEVVPLVEALFRVRTDRGGRGVLGNSMGANGALLIGFRHPDRFGFVGALSPTYISTANRAAFDAWAEGVWALYLADQGYSPAAEEEARYYALDPLFYAAAVLAAEPEVVTAIGDGCLPNHGGGACAQEPPTGDPDQELTFRATFDTWAQSATERGVRFTNIQREGAHDAVQNRDNFVRHFLPRMNEVFERAPAGPPERVSYRSVDLDFGIFGWELSVTRPNVESLHVLGARTDGTEVTLAGTGEVHVVTPPLRPGHLYTVELTPDGGDVTTIPAVADAAGRVRFDVTLGAARTVNETRELVESGQFQFPHTGARIVAR